MSPSGCGGSESPTPRIMASMSSPSGSVGGRGLRTAMYRSNSMYAQTLVKDHDATLDDLGKAVNTLEEIERIARRVFGGAHPLTTGIEASLRVARAALRARETPQNAANAS